jgi:amino acid adenylation domain-containing protein/non-ribosomal peptide synthase protein (TIGR01720 family)
MPIKTPSLSPTQKSLLAQRLRAKNAGKTQIPAIEPLSQKSDLVLSYAQQRLWVLMQLEENSAIYNRIKGFRLNGSLDKSALECALTTLVERQFSLRMSFSETDGHPRVNLLNVYNPLHYTDLSEIKGTAQAAEIKRLTQANTEKPFNIAQGPLFRVQLITLGDDCYILLFNIHHIISDGWSSGVLVRELQTLYKAYAQNLTPLLPNLPIQYTDYAAWQRNWLQGAPLERQLAYWKQQLANAPELLELPTDYPRPADMSYQGAHLQTTVGDELTLQLKQLSQQHGVTLYMTLLTAFNILLSRYSSQEDILVGSPIANRTHRQTEDLIGFFVNTLVLRTVVNWNQPVKELLKQVRQTALEAYSHQDIPFEYLVEQLNPSRSLSHSPLFQVMFVLQNAPTEKLELGRLNLSFWESEHTTAKFDLTLSMTEQKDKLVCDWEYCTDLFHNETIARMAEHFQVLLEGLVKNPSQSVSQLPLLTKVEQQQLVAWNQTEIDYPKDQTIIDLFEQQVSITPDNLAVVFENQQLSYQQLNTKANQLAHYLMTWGVKAEILVGICVERSLEMVIGLLGILKAGGAYVPLDPDYPQQRLQFMLEDSSVAMLFSQSHLLERLPVSTAKVVCLDSEWEQIAAGSGENPLRQSGPENLAYVIYTSGSTGVPKGVMVEHAAISQHINYSRIRYQIEPSDNVLQFASLNFDASIEQILSTWCGGARLILLSTNILPVNAIQPIIFQEQITIANLPPAYWQQLLHGANKPNLEPLKLLILGGDALSSELAQQTRQILSSDITILNAYGPTEATITATLFEVTEQFQDNNTEKVTPIGQPIANTQITILDANHNPTPLGIPGELCIAGAGLARGYLNRPELTAEKFIEIELFGKPQRIYKTGDKARWLPDGNIEYQGRLDHQVKLRGFRIELSEIEVTLSQHEAVKEAVVTLYEADDNKRLVAYITTNSESNELVAELKDSLKASLPDYMIPSHFTMLDKLPLTPNGKIDRKALPTPELNFTETYEAPRNDIEQQLAQIWSSLLKLTNISIHDNFFSLGGDSILSIQIVARARQAGLHFTPRDLFEHQTVAELAMVVGFGIVVNAEQGLVTGESLLTPIQHWFFAQDFPEYWHFNQSILLRVPANLKVDALRQALAAVLSHHDALRLRYHLVNGDWQQSFAPHEDTVPLSIEYLSQCENPAAELHRLTQSYQTRLNLTDGPLTQMVLFKLADSARLFWCIHHLVVDGVSWRILHEDLHTAYTQIAAGKAPQLPAKTSSFKVWAERLNSYAVSEVLTSELADWQALPTLSLPIDNLSGSNRLEHYQNYTITLNRKQTEALLRSVPTAYNTRINDVLLTALALALAEWTKKSSCLIDLEGHGRADLFDDIDLSRTVSWFTTIHPIALRLPSSYNEDLGAALKAIKEQLRAIQNEGIGYGLLTQIGGNILPKGDILFNYLGQFEQGIEADFEFANETTGNDVSLKGKRDHLIDINGAITKGKLSLNWSYSGDCYLAETIEALAVAYQKYLVALIQHCGEYSENQPNLDTLLPLHINKDAQATLFCLPGIGSKAEYFRALAKSLDTTLAVYGLESPGLDGQSQIPETVEALAQYHLGTIRATQPNGPYYLMGHSFGTAVALEIAWRLEQAGETLALLAVFDRPTSQYTQVSRHMEQQTEFEWLWNIVLTFKHLADIKPPFSLDVLKKTGSLNYAYRTVMNWLKQENVHDILFSSKGLPEELQALVKVYRANAQALSVYQPQNKRLRCTIDLFCAAESINKWKELPDDWGWKEHTLTGVRIHQVTGSHFSMLKAPHVKILANKLTNILKRGQLLQTGGSVLSSEA